MFCIPKVPLLHCKSATFTSSKRHFHNAILAIIEMKVFVKSNEQSKTCFNSAMARKRALI